MVVQGFADFGAFCGGEWHLWNANSLRKSKGLPLPFKKDFLCGLIHILHWFELLELLIMAPLVFFFFFFQV